MGYLSARACNADVRLGKAGTAGAGSAWKRVRADAAQRRLSLFVGELRAGAALSLAGFSSGRSVGARGGDGGNNSEFGMRNSKLGRGAVLRGDAALSPHFAPVLCLIWDSIKISCPRSRLPRAAQRQQDGLREVRFCSARVGSADGALAVLLGRLSWLTPAVCRTAPTGRLAGGCVSVPRGSGAMRGSWRFCWVFELAHACCLPYSTNRTAFVSAPRGSGALTGRWRFCWGV